MSEASTERHHIGSPGLHARPASEVLDLLLSAQLAAVSCLAPVLPALERAAGAAATALLSGGRMGYAGAGSSGLMALADGLELAGTFGLPPERTPILFAGGAAALLHMRGDVEDDTVQALADLDRSGLAAGDVLIAISASGTTPYVLTIGQAAQARGIRLIGIANVAGTALLDLAEIPVLLDSGPEVVAGSTRLGAASAQKVALNLISVLVGLRLGHIHDGYMVNVVADNAKLINRAARITAAIAGVPPETARAALAQAGGQVKPAILIARGHAPGAAAAALADSGGHLAPWLAVTNKSNGPDSAAHQRETEQ